MSKTRSKQGSENKRRDCSNVSKTIKKQGVEGSLEYCANGSIGVSSPMYKTRPKKGIEGRLGDRSNVLKTIVKKYTEGSLGHCANGQINIGKSYFERGMTTYAQKWNKAEIYKRKSAGGRHTEKKNHDATPVRRSRDHKHIGLLMRENLSFQLSCHHLASIEITCACWVWQFVIQLMKPYKNMQREGAL